MQLSPWILVLVVLVNAWYVLFMFWLQAIDKSLPPRRSIIPGSAGQEFLYVQDFWSCTWGDFVGVPLIVNAFVHLAVNGSVGLWGWIAFVVIAIVDGFGFLKMCLGENHKPDQGYPTTGEVSLHGLSHIPYHGVNVAMGALVVWHAIWDLRGPVLWLAATGLAIYAVTVVIDFKVGNFDPLKEV